MRPQVYWINLPMAGHKGYAIAAIMDMLSGVLTGSGFGAAVDIRLLHGKQLGQDGREDQ